MSKFVMQSEMTTDHVDWGSIGWRTRPANTGCKTFVVMDVGLEPGFGHDFHKHPQQDELITVLAGTIEQWIDGEKHDPRGRRLRLPRQGRRARVVQRRRRVRAPVRRARAEHRRRGLRARRRRVRRALGLVALNTIGEPLRIAHRGYRAGRVREHPRGVRRRDRARRGRPRGGRAAAARRRARRPPRPRRRAGCAAARRRARARRAKSRVQLNLDLKTSGIERPLIELVRDAGPDRPRHVHGRQLGAAGRHPPRRAGHPRRASRCRAACWPRALQPAAAPVVRAGARPASSRRYDAQVVSCHRELVSRLLVRRLHAVGKPRSGSGRSTGPSEIARLRELRGRRHLLRRPREPRLGRAGSPSLPDGGQTERRWA